MNEINSIEYYRKLSLDYEFMFLEQKKISDELRKIIESYTIRLREKDIELSFLRSNIKPTA